MTDEEDDFLTPAERRARGIALANAVTGVDFRALKSRLNIVEIVSAVVALRPIPGSKNLRGLSPFEPEKSPSFFVSPDKGLYKCFRTGKAGDAIRFVMETERLDFFAACKVLAQRYGVPLVEQNFIE